MWLLWFSGYARFSSSQDWSLSGCKQTSFSWCGLLSRAPLGVTLLELSCLYRVQIMPVFSHNLLIILHEYISFIDHSFHLTFTEEARRSLADRNEKWSNCCELGKLSRDSFHWGNEPLSSLWKNRISKSSGNEFCQGQGHNYGIRTFCSRVFSLLGAKVSGGKLRSQERKFPGTFAPGNEVSHWELSFLV